MRPSLSMLLRASSTLLILLSPLALADDGPDDLKIETTKAVTPPCKRPTQYGDTISVHYRGTLAADGSEFDSSYGRGRPFAFTLGEGQVIAGWDMGLVGMCVGEGRRLTIPSRLAYGEAGVGRIPPGATLVFETELMGIAGVKEEVPAPTPAPGSGSEGGSGDENEDMPADGPEDGSHDRPHDRPEGGPEGGPDDENDGECRLLGPFALLIQGALGGLALLSLVWKRWRETPRRPLKIWAFDVSKQVFGSVLLHLANLFMSMFSSGTLDMTAKAKEAVEAGKFVQDDGSESKPNPCSFYLLNLAIDTTIGIPILYFLLILLHRVFLQTPLANPPESLRSGNYGHPPRWTWWLKQSLVYFLGLFGMKLCVFFIFQLLPWIAWVGDWALRWTEGKEWVQVTFVMLVFPCIMNAIQYWIIDNFIKEKAPAGQREEPRLEEERGGLLGRGRRSEEDEEEPEVEDQVAGQLKEANPTVLPARAHSHSRSRGSNKRHDYDPEIDGASASSSSGSEGAAPARRGSARGDKEIS